MLEEAPETLIHSATEGFETQPDVASIGRINELGEKVAELWRNEENLLGVAVSALENELRALREEIEMLKQPTAAIFEQLHLLDKEVRNYTDAGHFSGRKPDVFSLINEQIVKLDAQKISLAKQLSEMETTIMQMRAAEMKLARREDEILEQRAAALLVYATSNINLTTMKIMLFKKFGIHIEGSEKEGNDKIVIFSERKSDPAKVLDVDPKFLDYFISNYIWEQLGTTDA